MAAVVVGVLAVVLGVSIVGGVMLGTLAVALGVRAQAGARSRGTRSTTAVVAVVLGGLGIAVAAGTYAYVRGDLTDYRSCRRASVSIAQDRACEQELRRGIEGG